MPASNRMTRRRLGMFFGAGLTGVALGLARDDDKEPADGQFESFARGAKRYKLILETQPPRPLTLVNEPILKWTNPLRKTNDGEVFVWVADGRPEVVASFYRYQLEGEAVEEHEFQSLATVRLSGLRDGRVVWLPPKEGVTLQPVPGATVPADSPAGRLRQMRALAREFKAFFDLPKNTSELRLLTNPLYRYTPTRPDLVDGALFAFVETTDPEVILMLEARRPQAGAAPAWHYALARSSMVNLRAEHQGRDIWRVGWVIDVAAPGKPYLTIAAPTTH